MAQSNEGSELFEIRESPGKGVGMFAKKKIERGQLVLAEKPLLVMPAFYLSAPTDAQFEKAYISKLSEEDKKKFFALTDSSSPNQPSIVGIISTNGLPLGVKSVATQGAIFPVISRINHSCRPNVCHTWHSVDKVEKVHAVKDILPGEELSTSYINIYQTRDNRRRDLLEKFHFVCQCAACCLADEKLAFESDERRAAISRLDEIVPSQAVIRPQAALQSLDKLFELLKEEDLDYDASAIARASYDYFSILYQMGMTKNLAFWARRVFTNWAISDGPNNDNFNQARFKDEMLKLYRPSSSKSKSKSK